MTSRNQSILEMSVLIKGLGCLSYIVVILFIGCHVDNLIRNPGILRIAVVDLPVGRFHETVLIYTGKACQRVDESDVRSFGSLHGAHTSVVGIMDIPDFHAGTVS